MRRLLSHLFRDPKKEERELERIPSFKEIFELTKLEEGDFKSKDNYISALEGRVKQLQETILRMEKHNLELLNRRRWTDKIDDSLGVVQIITGVISILFLLFLAIVVNDIIMKLVFSTATALSIFPVIKQFKKWTSRNTPN